MNRKILAVLLCLCMAATLAACDSEEIISNEHMSVVEEALGAMFNIDVMPTRIEAEDSDEVAAEMQAYWNVLAEAEKNVFGSDGQLVSLVGDEYMLWTKDLDRCSMKLVDVVVTDKSSDGLPDYDEPATVYNFTATVEIDYESGEDESCDVEGTIMFLPTGKVRTLSLTQESLEKLR